MLNTGFKIFKDFNDWFYIQEKNTNSSPLGLGNILSPQGSNNLINEFEFLNKNKSLIKKIFLTKQNTIVIFNNNDFFISGIFFSNEKFEKIDELSGKNITNIFQISENEIIFCEEKDSNFYLKAIDKTKQIFIPNWFNISPFQFEVNKIVNIKSNEKAIFVMMKNGEFYIYNKTDLTFNSKEINKWNIIKIPNTKINKVIDFDTNSKSCIIICKDIFNSFYLYAAGDNSFGQLGLNEKKYFNSFNKIELDIYKPKKIYMLENNSYIIDEPGNIYSSGKKDLLIGIETEDLNYFKKYNKNLLISEMHLTENAAILESNQKSFYFFGLNNGMKLDEYTLNTITNEPEIIITLSDFNVETFVNNKADIFNVTTENEEPEQITTSSTTKIKIKYKKNTNGTYQIEYLDTSEIKEKPLLVLAYSEKGKNKFHYVNEETVFSLKKDYDFKVISLISEKYQNSLGIISFPKIKECLEISKNNYTNLKINSEYKDIIALPIDDDLLITDKFKNKPLFFKFEIFDYDENKIFSLIDEYDQEIENLIIEKENDKYFVYFEMLNDTKYSYCFYSETDEVKYYKKINNIIRSHYFRNEKDDINIYFKKSFVKNKVFTAKYMEHFGYEVVYKIPVPADLLVYKEKIKITNDSEMFNNYFIVNNEFYIYGNNIADMLRDNVIYFKINNSSIAIEWVKNESGIYSNKIQKEKEYEWKTFINQHINKITKDYFKNDDEIVSFNNFIQFCLTNKIENNFENYKTFCFKNINNDMIKNQINISESWIKEKTPVWVNDSPVQIKMWENETLTVEENRKDIETTLLKNTIIDSEIKKIQSDLILKNEIKIENVFANFELSKKYFKNNNKFEENINGNIILNPIKNELLIYEPYSKYEQKTKQEEIEVIRILNYDNKESETEKAYSPERQKYLSENFRATSKTIVTEGSIYAGISLITGDVII